MQAALLALALLTLGAPVGGQGAAFQGGGVSGSFGSRADAYLSFSITGGNLKLRPGTVATYEGTWSGGAVTLSGEMVVNREGGTVSFVTMGASVGWNGGAGKTWRWPAPGQDGRVEGRTVSQRYSLAYRPPAGLKGQITGSVYLEVCGGGCGRYSVDFFITVAKAAPAPKPTGRPVVRAFAPRKTAEPGKPVTLEYSVKDPSGRATVHLFIYQGGDRVMRGSGKITANGGRRSVTPTLSASLVGPLFFCVWAENAKGVRSAGSPKSSCAWIPFLVPVKRVSNACGGEGWDTLVKIANFFGNEHSYVDSKVNPLARSYTVSFVDACDLHDAGYAGVMVEDPINGGVIDYRTWARKRVDDKFYNDMVKLCNERIEPPEAKVAREKCTGTGGPASIGARRLHNFVLKYGWRFFDADLTMGGVQAVPNYRAKPAGGARSNFRRK